MRLSKEIREKCYPAYMHFSQDMIDIYQRAINCILTNKPEPISADRIDNATFKTIWPKFLYKIAQYSKQIVLYLKSLPGFSQLDHDDLEALFKEHCLFNLIL